MLINDLDEIKLKAIRNVSYMLAAKDDNFGPYAYYETIIFQYNNDLLDHEQLKTMGLNLVQTDIRPSERRMIG